MRTRGSGDGPRPPVRETSNVKRETKEPPPTLLAQRSRGAGARGGAPERARSSGVRVKSEGPRPPGNAEAQRRKGGLQEGSLTAAISAPSARALRLLHEDFLSQSTQRPPGRKGRGGVAAEDLRGAGREHSRGSGITGIALSSRPTSSKKISAASGPCLPERLPGSSSEPGSLAPLPPTSNPWSASPRPSALTAMASSRGMTPPRLHRPPRGHEQQDQGPQTPGPWLSRCRVFQTPTRLHP